MTENQQSHVIDGKDNTIATMSEKMRHKPITRLWDPNFYQNYHIKKYHWAISIKLVACVDDGVSLIPTKLVACVDDGVNLIPTKLVACVDNGVNLIPTKLVACVDDGGNLIPAKLVACVDDGGNLIPTL